MKKLQQQYTPDIKVQTGPGLPVWSWQRATLRWNGPVAADERLRLWLLPPWATRILLLAGLALLLAIGGRTFVADRWKIPPTSPLPLDRVEPEGSAPSGATVTALALSLLLAGLLAPDAGRAMVAGHDLATESLAARATTGWMPDSFGTWDALTCSEIGT